MHSNRFWPGSYTE